MAPSSSEHTTQFSSSLFGSPKPLSGVDRRIRQEMSETTLILHENQTNRIKKYILLISKHMDRCDFIIALVGGKNLYSEALSFNNLYFQGKFWFKLSSEIICLKQKQIILHIKN